MEKAVAIDIEELVRGADDLEALPPSASRLAALLSNDGWDARDVERIVRFDAVLTARVLRAANSAAAGSLEPVVTVGQAALRLGLGTVLGLAVAEAVKKVRRSAAPVYGLGDGDLWRHSVCAALATDLLRRRPGQAIPAEAFVAALMHDVGKLVIARHLPEDALTRIRAGRQQGLPDHEAEMRVLMFTHATLGGVVASSWGLPAGMVLAISSHHEAPDAANDPCVSAVQVADGVAKAVANGLTAQTVAASDPIEARRALGLEPRDYGRVCMDAAAQLGEVLSWYD